MTTGGGDRDGGPQVSVVVPTYRGAATLDELVSRIAAVLAERGGSFEIVVVDDASPDDSWQVLERLAAAFPELRALQLLGNGGQYRATMCGLAHARGDVVVTMDDDLEHPPEEIPVLLDALGADPDLDAVVGSWGLDRGWLRNLGTRVHRRVNHLAYGSPKGFRHSAFRAMRGIVVESMVAHETRNPVVSALLWQSTRRVANVDLAHDDRRHGGSGFRVRFGVRVVLHNLFQSSVAPLRAFAALGVVAAVMAALASATVLARWLFGTDPPPGWASVFLATMFFGGATLAGLGLLGEYVALIMSETKGTPRWKVRAELTTGSALGSALARDRSDGRPVGLDEPQSAGEVGAGGG